MLTALRRIVQEVAVAGDFFETLNLCASRAKEALDTDACSILLLDNKRNEYVLMATDGLAPAAVGKLRVAKDAGLVGFVGQREEPINIDDAKEHPSYRLDPEIGEEAFQAYMGVPIIAKRQLLGVLIVQQAEKRRYDESEEAFLVTLCAQLANIIDQSEFTLPSPKETSWFRRDESEQTSINGIGCVPGVGIGQAVVIYPKADLASVPDRATEDMEGDIASFEQAVIATRKDIKALANRFAKELPQEEHALFDMYLSILANASLGAEVIEEIHQGHWAQGALRRVIDKHIKHFATVDDPYLRERITDIQDIGRRVLAHLQAQQQPEHDYPEQTILVGEEISAADMAEVPEGKLVAIVSVKGSSNAHVAILARALSIPTVMGLASPKLKQLEEKELIVDGYNGHIYVSPSRKLRKEYQQLLKEEQELNADLQDLRDLPTVTPDGHEVQLYVNTGMAADAGLSLTVGAAGVGLFRSEMPFMRREGFPAEQDQRKIYHQLLKAFAPRPVIMRTLDVGGDKMLPYFPVEESNPYLGWRGIRITLDHPDVFLVQIRAMLAASQELNNLSIMLPMISGVTEVDDALELIHRAYRELQDEGLEIPLPAIGAMIEVPSAVYQIEELASRLDFLSVGSNDLTQYMLAVDRNNARVSHLYDSLHPAILRALFHITQTANRLNKPVSICGEMACDPLAVLALLGMDFSAMSMNPASLLRVKWIIRNFSREKAKNVLKEILNLDNPRHIRELLAANLVNAGLGGLIRAGKD